MMANLGLIGPQILLKRNQFQAGLGIGFDERFVVFEKTLLTHILAGPNRPGGGRPWDTFLGTAKVCHLPTDHILKSLKASTTPPPAVKT